MAGGDTEVAIIGGGAAGIAAARRLAEAGFECLIIEARSRLGGRAWTVAPDPAAPIDLGCGWLHSGDRNPWREIAEAQGRAIDRTPPPWSRPSPQPHFPLEDQASLTEAREAFYARLDGMDNAAPDVPAAAFLEADNRWNSALDAVSTYFSGAELIRVSARDLLRYDDSGVNWRIADGYGATILAHGDGLPVVLDCPVRSIDHRGPTVKIETPRGTITASRAIVTLPTNLIAAETIRFVPALPEKVDAAAGLPLGLADKLFIALDQADDFEADSRLIGRTDRTATATYHMRPFGRPLIEAYFGGGLAADLERGGLAAFFRFATDELTSLFGSDFARRIRPIAMHGWGADPFAGGSYSYALPGHADDRARLAALVGDRLFFAGEACSTHDYSTAHGAYRTGIAAAQAIIAARANGWERPT